MTWGSGTVAPLSNKRRDPRSLLGRVLSVGVTTGYGSVLLLVSARVTHVGVSGAIVLVILLATAQHLCGRTRRAITSRRRTRGKRRKRSVGRDDADRVPRRHGAQTVSRGARHGGGVASNMESRRGTGGDVGTSALCRRALLALRGRIVRDRGLRRVARGSVASDARMHLMRRLPV